MFWLLYLLNLLSNFMHFWSPQNASWRLRNFCGPALVTDRCARLWKPIPLFDNVDLITPLTLLQLFWHPLNQQLGHIQGVFLSSRWNMPKQLHFQMRTSHFLRKMVNFGTMTGMGQWQMAIWLAQHIFEASARNICFIQFKIWTKYAKFDTYKKGLSCS